VDTGELGTTAPIDDDAAQPSDATYGRFVSLGVLGRGGMGVVLRARDPELDREVAIKVLASPRDASSSSARRLQLEAQAMAKLSHPNVLTVYEMGQVGDQRFIAMELVVGTTLRSWLQSPRTPQQITAAFVACGRGLAAAHAAGLVHRDFKPENVLIGADGRPRVSDFGLVGVSDGSTLDGSVFGTPAYMAPEQWLGEDTDARSDVFSFCVALWEALYGARPFEGTGTLRDRVLAGTITPPPKTPGVGKDIALLRRGLARDRADRWPAITDLLAQLEPAPRRRWPWLVAAGTGACAAIAIGWFATRDTLDPCPDPEPRLATIWDSTIAAKLTAAFQAAAPAIAADTSTRVITALDRYALRWREAGITACRATHVDGAQSAEMLDQRIACLDRRRDELRELTSSLATADRTRVQGAVDAVGALGDLAHCANRERLLAAAPPSDPEQRRKVDELRREIDASHASRLPDKPGVRQARAAAAVDAARAIGHVPLLVRALEEASHAATDNGDHAAAEAWLRELAQRAAEAHDDVLAARAWIDLIRLLTERHRLDEAKTLEPVATAAVTRAGSPAKLRYVQLATVGIRKMYSEDFAGAVASLQEAVAATTTDQERAAVQLALSQVVSMKDGPAAALPIAEQSLTATEAAYGSSHPRTADAFHLIAQYSMEIGQLDRAIELETRVLAIRETAYGPDHRDVAVALHALGNIHKDRGEKQASRPFYERAIAILDRANLPNEAGLTRGMLAQAIADTDGLPAARPWFARALTDLAAAGKDRLDYIAVAVDYAVRLIETNACGEATPLLAHAIERLPATSPRHLPSTLEAAAQCDVVAKRPAVAIAKLERARAVCGEVECPKPLATMLTWRLGKLLVDSATDRARGQTLVDEARAAGDAELMLEIDTWRKRR
jgi:tetratricopeptide (TPR) repeat protein